MKRFIAIVSIVVFTLLLSISSIAQPPPSPPAGVGSGDHEIGGNAPIGGGLFILLGLGAAYGIRKLYKFHQEEDEAIS